MWATVLLRGEMASVIKRDADKRAALRRSAALADLHSTNRLEVFEDAQLILVHAAAYYTDDHLARERETLRLGSFLD